MTKTKKYTIKTYGCQMNELDSERIAYILGDLGYQPAESLDQSDIIIYNTCIIRKNAELKVYGHLGSLKPLKEAKPDLIIAVCGCMMEIDEAKKNIKEKYKHVDIVFGPKNIESLPDLIAECHQEDSRVFEVEATDDIDKIQLADRNSKHSAYINIIYGCNNFCSYCIVPFTRGREQSRSFASILEEARILADQGYKEITLLGQNVNSYGLDLEENIDFADLLQAVSEIEGIERLRFMSGHPKDFSDKLIELIAKNPKVCKHVHLPLQSGSTDVLRRMRRTYSKEQYLDLAGRIRDKIPGVTISSDVIVGFPGESEEDLEDTIDVLEKVGLDQAYLYKYSMRVGTMAAEMTDQIDEDVKQDRFERVLEVVNKQANLSNSRLLDSTQEVLVEGTSKNDLTRLTGRTETNKIINFPGEESLIGELIDLKITNYNSFSLEGQIAGEN